MSERIHDLLFSISQNKNMTLAKQKLAVHIKEFLNVAEVVSQAPSSSFSLHPEDEKSWKYTYIQLSNGSFLDIGDVSISGNTLALRKRDAMLSLGFCITVHPYKKEVMTDKSVEEKLKSESLKATKICFNKERKCSIWIIKCPASKFKTPTTDIMEINNEEQNRKIVKKLESLRRKQFKFDYSKICSSTEDLLSTKKHYMLVKRLNELLESIKKEIVKMIKD